jgi:hypothetical protein
MPTIGAATPHSDVFAELHTTSNVFYPSVRLPSAQKSCTQSFMVLRAMATDMYVADQGCVCSQL